MKPELTGFLRRVTIKTGFRQFVSCTIRTVSGMILCRKEGERWIYRRSAHAYATFAKKKD